MNIDRYIHRQIDRIQIDIDIDRQNIDRIQKMLKKMLEIEFNNMCGFPKYYTL